MCVGWGWGWGCTVIVKIWLCYVLLAGQFSWCWWAGRSLWWWQREWWWHWGCHPGGSTAHKLGKTCVSALQTSIPYQGVSHQVNIACLLDMLYTHFAVPLCIQDMLDVIHVADQIFCEHHLGLDCCFCWQRMGSSLTRLVDVVITYCGKCAPFYIFSFNITIFRTVTPILNEDLLQVLHRIIGQVYISYNCYFIHVLLHTCKTEV